MNPIHTRHSAVAVLALGVLGIFACNRDSDRASTTWTTSAEMDAVDRSGVATPPGAVIAETTVYGDPSLASSSSEEGSNDATGDKHAADKGATGARYIGELDDNGRWTAGAGAPRNVNPFIGRSGDNTSKVTTDQGGAGAKASGVGPGHIWYTPSTVKEPARNARGTGAPDSNGSHDLGAK